MKRLIRKSYTIILTFLLTTMASCEKFLESTPKSFLSPDNFYNTEAKLMDALAGVYDILGSQALYRYRNLVWFNNEADEGYFRNTSTSATFSMNYPSNDPQIKDYWTETYSAINRANYLISNVDKNLEISESYRKMIRGEALFLRAFYYFSLVQNFGDVPLILEPTLTAENVEIPRTPSKEIYDQIISDMELSEGMVLDIKELGTSGRVSKSAVRGVLARVCLHMAGKPVEDKTKYEKAIYWAEKVINDGNAGHHLNPSYSQIFINYAQDKYDLGESIWEVVFYGNNVGVFKEAGLVGFYNGVLSNNVLTGKSSGQLRTTYKMWNLYAEEDLRRDWAIANFSYLDAGPSGAKKPITFTSAQTYYDRYCGKFRREYELTSVKAEQNTPINYPLLRFSDVLLMYAEAVNEFSRLENGSAGAPPQSAIDALLKVRDRGYGKNLNISNGIVRNVRVVNGGSGFTTAPTITIVGGGGTGAQAIATLENNKIIGIEIIDQGSGYTSNPTVSYSGGGGSGATFQVTITNVQNSNSGFTASQIDDKDKFLQIIIDERARELCFEGLRRHDLIRWGKFLDNMHEVGAHFTSAAYSQRFKNVSQKHLLWPIPPSEFSVNRKLTQNLYW